MWLQAGGRSESDEFQPQERSLSRSIMVSRSGVGASSSARMAATSRVPRPRLTSSHRRRLPTWCAGGGDSPVDRVQVADSKVSLKQQIREAARGGEDSRPLKPLPRTKFRQQRRPSKAEEDEDDVEEVGPTHTVGNRERRRLGQTQMLIVDGYNVCGCWPKLKEPFRAGRIEESRNLLIEELSFFADVRILVVFDAANATEPTKTRVTEWLDIVFVSDADEYIDSYVPKDGDADICVVTSDNLTRSLAGTAGARLMSSADFVAHVEDTKAKDTRELKVLSLRDQQRGALRFALKEDARNRLLRMRQSLPSRPAAEEEEEIEEEGEVEEGGPLGGAEGGAKATSRSSPRRRGRGRPSKPKPRGGKGTDVPSANPLSMLGSSADSRLMSLRGALPSRPTGEECEAAKEQEEAVEEGQEIAEKAPAPAAAADAGVTRLFVGRLPAGFGNADLKKLFESHGAVRECKVIMDRAPGRPPVSKGYGFVTMAAAEAREAMGSLDGRQVDGRRIAVKVARGGDKRGRKGQRKGRKP